MKIKSFIVAALAVLIILPMSNVCADQMQVANSGSQSIAGSAIEGDINSGNKTIGAPIPGSVAYGPVMNYFGNPLPSAGFQPVEDVILYDCWFTEGSLQSMLKGRVRADFQTMDARWNAQPTEKGATKWIKVVISGRHGDKAPLRYVGQKGHARQKGFITAEAMNDNANMVSIVAKAGLEAIENGCNVLHFSAQGAVRDAFSHGWGVGITVTRAGMNNDGDITDTGVGGTGYSSAHAGTRDLPWAQAYGLVDPDLVAPQSEAAQVIN